MRLIAVLVTLFPAASLFAQPVAQMKVTAAPITDSKPSEVICTVTAAQPIASGQIVVYAPVGFTADPQTTTIPALAAGQQVTRRPNLKASDSTQATGTRSVSVELSVTTDSTKAVSLVGSETTSFVYTNSCIPAARFLMWGILGVLLGYVVRFLVNLLKKATPTQVAAAFGASPTLPEKWYPVIDGAVTLVLGFLVLASFLKDGRPPEQACTW